MGELYSSFTTDPETGQMRVLVSDKDLPDFLISAKGAIEDGRLEEAAELLNEQAVKKVGELTQQDPSRMDISFMLALMLDRIDQPENAERWYRSVIEQEPNALAYHKLADVCRRTDRLPNAIRYESEAVRTAPGNTRFLTCLAIYLLQAGRTSEGLDKLQKVVDAEPDNSDAHSKLLFHMHYLSDPDPRAFLAEHKRWAQMHAPTIRARTSHGNIPDPGRRLRVGYISPDFHVHSVAYNFEPFLRGRNSDAVEVYGYGNVQKQDETTERLKQQFDHYRDIRCLGDQEASHLIEQDKIDILVEIGGHIGNNRLGILAYKPAPIQVDYGGLNTTGMKQIDYRLTDSLLDPLAMDRFYVEESVRLPGGLFCYSPPDYAPQIAPSPVHENGFITFGSFNNNMKMNPHIISLWAQVLRTNNDSRLLLKYAGGNDPGIKEEYLTQFEQYGIDRRRIQICGWKTPVEHLRTFDKVDIALDTYPFNGCVTTLESLWMGVPIISLVGNTSLLSRVGLSILSRVGMEFLAAATPAEFVAKATALASKPDALSKIRDSMRTRMAASTLCDNKRFAREVEQAYRMMWRRWCRSRNGDVSEKRDTDDAIDIYLNVIAQGRKSCKNYQCLGELYLSVNEFENALKWLRKAVELNPSDAQLLERIVSALVGLGRIDDAAEQVRSSIGSNPDIEIIHGSLTEALILTDLSDDGNTDIKPKESHTKAILLIADTLFGVRQYKLAEQWYKKIIKDIHDASTCARLASACRFTGNLSDALEYQQKAVEQAPNNAEYTANLGTLLMSMDQKSRGIEMLRQAAAKAPDQARIHSSYLANLHYMPDLNPEILFAEHKLWGQLHAPAKRARTSHQNIPDPDRKLCIGYISADFRMHSVAYNFAAFLDNRDPEKVEVYGYGNVAVPDRMTELLKQKFDCYRSIHRLDDEEVVRLIERDRIDILVEIGGHTSDNRLGVMAYKPAPIQVDYGGFNTTGMRQIDYRLTDALLDPAELQRFYVEESVYLPGGLFCYKPPEFAPSVGPLPARQNGFLTFGSFSNGIKINSNTLSLWAEVLKSTDNSRMILKFRGGNDRCIQEHYLNQFEQMGISGDRITFFGWKSPVEHLDLYNQVDIALDTYPFCGCMTTLEGLWMGVPVISLVGKNSLLSRTGLSILSRLDMEFFAASTPDEYVSKAFALAQKLDALAGIRNTLRRRMMASTLCNGPYYARCLEKAYRGMWRKWCRNRTYTLTGRKHKDAASARPKKSNTKNGTLDFFISDNSDLQFTVFKAGLPASLLKATKAVNVGNIAEANSLLDDQTVRAVEQMVRDDPARTDALFMLAALFAKTGNIRKAERLYREILKLKPHALVLFELANICRDTGRLSEAVRYQKQAVELSPDSPELWTTLAEYIIRTGRTQEGIDLLRKAVEAKPDKVNHSKYLWHIHQAPRLNRHELFEEHKKWASIHAPRSLAKRSHDNSRNPNRRLNVGYVSPDFCGHSVSYFFEPILDGHDRQAVQVYGYGNIPCPDQVTEHLKGKFDHYRNICGLDDDKVAEMIERDGIDILVDLAGHTSGNRLGVFARKPAPIQVTYLGFPDTTGMEQIDYRLTDELSDPPEAQQFHTEKLIFLPSGFLCYKPPGFAPPVEPLPAIERGYFTFGSFNNNCKIQPDIIRLWAKILNEKGKSRLLLKFGGGDDEAVRNHYLEQFRSLGISANRVKICGRKPTIEHLKLYGEVDIALDTFPYNGTTTTCEAMWMGVPTLSLVGEVHSSRVGLSILSRVGLRDFAASTPDEYVGKALAFSGELENLAKIRTFLRGMMFNSPLCNKKAFTQNLEAAYRKMWHKWCTNKTLKSTSAQHRLLQS